MDEITKKKENDYKTSFILLSDYPKLLTELEKFECSSTLLKFVMDGRIAFLDTETINSCMIKLIRHINRLQSTKFSFFFIS